jgi:hypothetical protein
MLQSLFVDFRRVFHASTLTPVADFSGEVYSITSSRFRELILACSLRLIDEGQKRAIFPLSSFSSTCHPFLIASTGYLYHTVSLQPLFCSNDPQIPGCTRRDALARLGLLRSAPSRPLTPSLRRSPRPSPSTQQSFS